ncbi:hypothetical protein DL98DRAFT_640824 [Cadophora sp. DSE1049]|nr:hypothetical protein DL98DRAFT_640824 [Cadophora sp. DSE1049]
MSFTHLAKKEASRSRHQERLSMFHSRFGRVTTTGVSHASALARYNLSTVNSQKEVRVGLFTFVAFTYQPMHSSSRLPLLIAAFLLDQKGKLDVPLSPITSAQRSQWNENPNAGPYEPTYGAPRSAQAQNLKEYYSAQYTQQEKDAYEEEYYDADEYIYDELEMEEPQTRRDRRRNRRRHDGTRGPRVRGPRPHNPYRPLLNILQPVTTGADRTMDMSLVAFDALFKDNLVATFLASRFGTELEPRLRG